ncbi:MULTISPECIES: CDGSH iron-sulfur domain-containing protein [unclassified Gordonia (in: high G+C Gram-positive bacteria)]|uniref:CDGSH iron-sulfur domain-containing protein n=1 Tax=unclassified Gordonia (in: high G+C Gram-positive bacteria) TaxID=2657482 RepID=UPI001F105C73|nr:CDGSH iron-sulfur domain-containing protein [Gordonia sp. ABSL49_1]MCH5644752.1 CDGSH iron-sulfur domain-containing protein [Gordonia sp. ABSL49_1]
MDTPDAHPPPTGRRTPAHITVTPGGPLVVRGDVEIVDINGNPIPRHRSTFALCRCGRSAIQPFCDGSHRLGRSPINGE